MSIAARSERTGDPNTIEFTFILNLLNWRGYRRLVFEKWKPSRSVGAASLIYLGYIPLRVQMDYVMLHPLGIYPRECELFEGFDYWSLHSMEATPS